MKIVGYTLALLLLAVTAHAQQVLVLDNLPTGEHYIKVVVGSDKSVSAVIVTPIRLGESPTTGGDGPVFTDGTIQSAVTKLVNAVPSHTAKDDIRKTLSALYITLAKDWESGKYNSIAPLMKERKSSFDFITKDMFNQEANWAEFDTKLLEELNKRDPQGENIGDSLAAIAEGLSGGEFISPKFIALVIELIQARDNPEALKGLLLKLLLTLIQGKIGG